MVQSPFGDKEVLDESLDSRVSDAGTEESVRNHAVPSGPGQIVCGPSPPAERSVRFCACFLKLSMGRGSGSLGGGGEGVREGRERRGSGRVLGSFSI